MCGGILVLGSINEVEGGAGTGRYSPVMEGRTRSFLEMYYEEVGSSLL